MKTEIKKDQVLISFETLEERFEFQAALQFMEDEAEVTYQQAAGDFMLRGSQENAIDTYDLDQYERFRKMIKQLRQELEKGN